MQVCALALTVLLTGVLSGCTQYRVVELERFQTQANSNSSIVTTYAAARNNMIIPEYVIDRNGSYPTEKNIAEQRLNERKDELNDFVKQKYDFENSASYQTKRIAFMVGQIVVSPVVLVVMLFTDLFTNDEEHPPFTFTKQYFKCIVNDPVPDKPVIRDETAVV